MLTGTDKFPEYPNEEARQKAYAERNYKLAMARQRWIERKSKADANDTA